MKSSRQSTPAPRYIIYARVSPRGSDWAGETSCEAQADECRRYLADRPGKIVRVVRDEFISGSTNERPALGALLAACRDGEPDWDVLVVHDIDRLVKSTRGWYQILDTLRQAGRSIIAVRQAIDYSTPYGSYTMDSLVRTAQLMLEIGAENTRRKMLWIARKGEWPAGKVPFGYRRGAPKDNVLQVHPEHAATVHGIFAAYAAGLTVRELRRTYPIPTNTVLDMLRNPIYAGRLKYADVDVPGKHAAIIEPALWDAVQARLPKWRGAPRPHRASRVYLLTGLIRCECGRTMSPATCRGANGTRYWHYRCGDTLNCPHRAHVPAIDLEEAVKGQVAQLVDDPAMVREVQRQIRAQAASIQPGRDAVDATATRLAHARRTIANLTDALTAGLIDADNAPMINAQIRAARAMISEMEQERAAQRAAEKHAATCATQAEDIAVSWAKLARGILTAGSPEDVRDIIRAHVRAIRRQGGAFVVTYALPAPGCSIRADLGHPEPVLVELLLRVA